MKIEKVNLKSADNGAEVFLYDLSAGDISARVLTYGAVLMGLEVPDRSGVREDITLGYDFLDEYFNDQFYFGAVVGRFANRIRNSRFSIDSVEYSVTRNSGINHLHGGINGFNKKVWIGERFSNIREVGVKLFCESKDGEEGYPGRVLVQVSYSVNSDNCLTIRYSAESSKPTPVNLAHHSYFNLDGIGESDILDHNLQIYADSYLPVDTDVIPTGEIAPVKGTPFDFSRGKTIDHNIDLVQGCYDNTFVINNSSKGLKNAAKLSSAKSGRVMELSTTKPGIHLYTGNYLDENVIGRNGYKLQKYGGLCLEDQHFPDSPNISNFPNTILRPGEIYKHETVYHFSVE